MKISELNRHSIGVTNEDIIQAMKKISGYLDITPSDFMEMCQMAYTHAFERLTSSIKAKDIMTQKVITINEDDSPIDTVKLMARHNISGLPGLESKGCIALDLKKLSAKDIMSSPPITIEKNTPVLKVANLFESHNINRVPVLDKHLNLVGVIARSDLVQAFC